MATDRFQKIMQDGLRAGHAGARTANARAWYRDQATTITKMSPQSMLKNGKAKLTTSPQIGGMYMYFYDPKLKKTLPFYDRFPCTLVIEQYGDGFLGMNLHYLPHTLRARLLDALYDVLHDPKYTAQQQTAVSYGILKRASRIKFFEPTIHRYLYNHVTSRYLHVQPNEWDTALFLPLERFTGASLSHVFAESRRRIQESK